MHNLYFLLIKKESKNMEKERSKRGNRKWTVNG